MSYQTLVKWARNFGLDLCICIIEGRDRPRETLMATDRLEEHRGLARGVAHDFSRSVNGHNEIEDLQSEATLGLMKAIREYKEDGSGTFESFARVVIRNHLSNWWRDCGPRPYREGVKQEPDPEIPRQYIQRTDRPSYSQRFSDHVESDEDCTGTDAFRWFDKHEVLPDALETDDAISGIRQEIHRICSHRSASILCRYLGIGGEGPYTQEELAEEEDLCQQRVGEIIEAAVRRLRKSDAWEALVEFREALCG